MLLATNTPAFTAAILPDAAAAPEAQVEAPADELVPRELLEWFQQMSMTQWGITVVVLVVFGSGALILLYRSASPATQALIRAGVTTGAAAIDAEAKRRQQLALLNDIDWDDPLWAAVVAGSDKLKYLAARIWPGQVAVTNAEAQARAVAKYGVPPAGAPLLPPDDGLRG